MNPQKTQFYFFFLLLLGVGVVALLLLFPYLQAITLGATLAIVFHPVYRKVRSIVGNKEGIAAFLLVLLSLFIVIVPLFFFGVQVFEEARDLYLRFRGSGFSDIPLRGLVEGFFERLPIPFEIDLDAQLGKLTEWIVGNFGTIFAGTLGVIAQFFLGLMVFYYLLKDGGKLKNWIVAMSPLPDKYDQDILSRMEGTVVSVIRGSVVVALIQGIFAGTGFFIFGVPHAALWGSITALAALIPAVGTALIIVPAAAFLFFSGGAGAALGLLVWGAVIVGLIDNFLAPRLIGGRAKVHPLLVLFSVLGGIGLFGPIGFLMGPLVMSFLLALLDIYVALLSRESDNKAA